MGSWGNQPREILARTVILLSRLRLHARFK